MFVHRDTVRKPLQQPYDGPFAVLDRSDEFYTLDLNGVYRSAKASLYRISSLPCCCCSSTSFFTRNISCCADHSTADLPTHIICPAHSSSNSFRPPCSLANSSLEFRCLVSHLWGSDVVDLNFVFTLFCSVVIPYLFSQTRDFCLTQYFVVSVNINLLAN